MADPIYTPVQVHNATTPESYETLQRDAIARLRARWPARARELTVWASVDHPDVLVSGGKWVVRCVCGNAPSVHPDWRTARCFECGAVYTDLVIPADRAGIEAALRPRPIPYRHWDRRGAGGPPGDGNAGHGLARGQA